MQEILAQLTPIAVGLGFTLLIVLVGAFFKFLEKKLGPNFRMIDTLGLIQQITLDIVKGLQQEVVEDLKAKSEDGKLTQEDIVSIKQLAIERILAKLPEATKCLAESFVGPIEDYVSDLIEARLFDIKHPN